jgi:hypothetical protein
MERGRVSGLARPRPRLSQPARDTAGVPVVYHAGLTDFNRADFVNCCSLKMVKIIDQAARRPFSPGPNILKCNIAAIRPGADIRSFDL